MPGEMGSNALFGIFVIMINHLGDMRGVTSAQLASHFGYSDPKRWIAVAKICQEVAPVRADTYEHFQHDMVEHFARFDGYIARMAAGDLMMPLGADMERTVFAFFCAQQLPPLLIDAAALAADIIDRQGCNEFADFPELIALRTFGDGADVFRRVTFPQMRKMIRDMVAEQQAVLPTDLPRVREVEDPAGPPRRRGADEGRRGVPGGQSAEPGVIQSAIHVMPLIPVGRLWAPEVAEEQHVPAARSVLAVIVPPPRPRIPQWPRGAGKSPPGLSGISCRRGLKVPDFLGAPSSSKCLVPLHLTSPNLISSHPILSYPISSPPSLSYPPCLLLYPFVSFQFPPFSLSYSLSFLWLLQIYTRTC